MSYSNDHFIVEPLRGEPIVRVRRTPVPFSSARDAFHACRPMLEHLDALGRRTLLLFFDSREAVGRNDPEYENWFRPYRRDLVRDFYRVAVLVSTPTGRLHSQRLLGQDHPGERCRVFDNEVAAFEFLRREARRMPLSQRFSSRPPRSTIHPTSYSPASAARSEGAAEAKRRPSDPVTLGSGSQG